MSQYSAFDLEDDDSLRRLLYLGAFLLFFLPYFQAFAGVFPFRLGDVRWRFQTAASMSGIMLLPFLGLSLALFIARSLDHKNIKRVIGVVSAFTMIALIGGLGLFLLDAIQVKSIVRDAEMQNFFKVVATAVIALTLAICSFAYLTLVAFKAKKGAVRVAPKSSKKAAATEEPVGLLIGQDYTKQ